MHWFAALSSDMRKVEIRLGRASLPHLDDRELRRYPRVEHDKAGQPYAIRGLWGR
jgi:hypothetical protein